MIDSRSRYAAHPTESAVVSDSGGDLRGAGKTGCSLLSCAPPVANRQLDEAPAFRLRVLPSILAVVIDACRPVALMPRRNPVGVGEHVATAALSDTIRVHGSIAALSLSNCREVGGSVLPDGSTGQVRMLGAAKTGFRAFTGSTTALAFTRWLWLAELIRRLDSAAARAGTSIIGLHRWLISSGVVPPDVASIAGVLPARSISGERG